MGKKRALLMDPEDNCATTIAEIENGEKLTIEGKAIRLLDKIPFGHKFATETIKKGEHVIKYGEIIGIAIKDIEQGEWIHTHNIKSYYLEVLADND